MSTGVSYKRIGHGQYKIRWRERQPDGSWKSRSRTIEASVLERDRILVEIREALAEHATVDPRVTHATLPPANLLEGMQEMIRQRTVDGRYTGKTSRTYTSYTLRIVEHIHTICRIPEDVPIPVTVLSRDLFSNIKERDQKLRIGQTVRYASVRLLLDAWEWMADDPRRWPHVPTPPVGRTRRDYLTRTPRYGRTVAPKLHHVDACLRALPPKATQSTRVAGAVMRSTGLRASQVFAIEVEDVDLSERTLRVREGKGVLERVEQRIVPLPSSLVEDDVFEGWVRAHESGPLFPSRPHSSRVGRGARRKLPTVTFGVAWQASGVRSSCGSRQGVQTPVRSMRFERRTRRSSRTTAWRGT